MLGDRRKQKRRAFILRWLKRLAMVLALIVGLAMVTGFTLLMIWPPINVVETGATPEYPEIQPRAYRFTQARVIGAVEEVLQDVARFSHVETDRAEGIIRGEAVSRTGWFIDDLEIRVEANGEGGAIVFIRSASRVGKADFGQNANNIRELFAEIEHNLGIQ